MTEDTPTREEFEGLRTEHEALKNDWHAVRKHKLFPTMEENGDAIAALLDDMQSVKAELREVRSENQRLEQKFESIAGLAEDEQSSPAKRAADVRQAMIRRAEAKEDDPDDPSAEVALYYKEVEELLADYGHGSVHRPQAFDAMRDAADADGFTMGSKLSRAGNRADAVILKLAELPAYARCNEITTAADAPTGSDTATHVTSSTQD
ncbi:hypothetical protein [Halomarina oriensis]|uniref:Uncharacterized protein n=1 Tax=Halomarina oriensis TaxID=671145 RepID=A0A6B0GIY9_9EURY|nr:hypothetical protein [Halomarina oriensis]MWG34842.1 hypothetical protein [Halomarina oriensis]